MEGNIAKIEMTALVVLCCVACSGQINKTTPVRRSDGQPIKGQIIAPTPSPAPTPTPVTPPAVVGSGNAPDPYAVDSGSMGEPPLPEDAGMVAELPPPVNPPTPAAPSSGTTTTDPFGVRKLYPTLANGREWYLPDNADQASAEWNVEDNPVTRVSPGVFQTSGNSGETRLVVGSPSGRAWWRNVEMTAYFRYVDAMDSYDQERHWELLARSERHSNNMTSGRDINEGVSAPPGTVTWPGYPFEGQSVNGHCLGSSYHGNVYTDGRALFEKETSHIGGYAGGRAKNTSQALGSRLGEWFGLKFVLRNAKGGQAVHMELWLDANADGNWVKQTATDDTRGGWSVNTGLDDCTAPPFSYTADTLISWAGPQIYFRSDSMTMDFRWLSSREIEPLP